MGQIRRILVAGAAGGLGGTISNRLFEAGYDVLCLIRPEDSTTRLNVSEKQTIRAYIEDPEAVYRALEGVDAVVNCAALLPNSRAAGFEAFRRVNVEGPTNLLLQSGKQGVKLAVFFSTISVVDHINRRITLNELREFDSDPNDPYQWSKVQMEESLAKESADFPGNVVILRPAFVYGPGNYSVWSEALHLLKTRKMILLNGGKALFPLVYSDDVAGFVLHLLEHAFSPAQTGPFVLASPERTTMRDVFDYLADQLGVPHARSVPAWIAVALASVAEHIPGPFRKGRLKLLTRTRVSQYSKGYDLSGVLDPAPLGFICGTDYRAGFRAMIREQSN